MATVHLLYGYLGSGKTTFAERLARRHEGVVVSVDEWTTGLSGDHVALDEALFERVVGLLAGLWTQVAARGVDVVLDYGFWRRDLRDRTRAQAAAVGARTRLYWLRCPDDVALARCLARNLDPAGGYRIDAAAFAALRAKLEPPGPDEPFEPVVTG